MDNERNEAPDAPKEGEYKGHPILILNPNSRYPFSFGLAKAKLILQHIETIKEFVKKYDQE